MLNLPDETVARLATQLIEHVAANPGQYGRIRCARLLRDTLEAEGEPVMLRDVVDVVDATIALELVTRTPGPRPTLVLTERGLVVLQNLPDGARA